MLERLLAHSLPDPAQSTLWYLSVPFTNNMVYHVLAERVSATFYKNPFRPRLTDGSNNYFPEVSDIDGINVTFYETFDYRVTKWLQEWRKLIKDSAGNYGLPGIYKKEMTVRMYSRDDLTNHRLALTYLGVAPSDQTPFELNYDDETGRTTVEAQFSVDDVEYDET